MSLGLILYVMFSQWIYIFFSFLFFEIFVPFTFSTKMHKNTIEPATGLNIKMLYTVSKNPSNEQWLFQ